MKRSSFNKDDVYQQFGWKYEDGDYDPKKIRSGKDQKDKHETKILDKINSFISRLIKNLRD